MSILLSTNYTNLTDTYLSKITHNYQKLFHIVTILTYGGYHPVYHLICHAGIDANPETVVHHEISHLQFAHYAIAFSTSAHLIKSRVLNEVACKEITRLDLVLLQLTGQFIAGKAGIFLHSNQESKPRRIAIWLCFRQDQLRQIF